MVKRSILLLIVMMPLMPVWSLYADDLEIFGGAFVTVKPNVLIVFDTSISMRSCVNSTNNCNAPNDRISAAKQAVKTLLDASGQDARFGLMKFNPLGGDGGSLVKSCGELTTADVDNLSANSSTPLAETLVEAGLYFAGEPSWFNAGVTYNSPIQYECQDNFIIVMTDGEPRDDFNANESDVTDNTYINLSGDPIGDYDNDSAMLSGGELSYTNSSGGRTAYPYSGSDYLDDVAAYLYDNDCNLDVDDDQKIKTYTIGFALDVGNLAFAKELLKQTAINGGTQDVYSASDTASLSSAFQSIFSNVQDNVDAIYAPPVIPRNPDNTIQAGNRVYMPFFKPQSDGRWIGNLKAYGLIDGVLQDMNGVPATYPTDSAATGYVAGKEGFIKPTAQSYWSTAADGLDVGKGGAGGVLNANNSRNVYTFTYVDTYSDATGNFIADTGLNDSKRQLSHQNNEFKTTTNNRLETILNAVYPTTAPDDIVNLTLNGTTVTYDDGTTSPWRLGDIIHSEPLVHSYNLDCNGDGDTPDDYLFVGANDGMLHVFCAADGGEEWAFVPPKQLSRLHLLDNGSHEYFVDGSPVIETFVDAGNTVKRLIFGEGRGGERYYVLDVTDPADPYWKFQVSEQKLQNADGDGDGALDGVKAKLGQSWAKPQRKRVRYLDSGSETFADVFLLTGGYDPRYETITFPPSVPQSPEITGRSIYTIDALTGSLTGLNINGGNWFDSSGDSVMQHSILDVTAFDANDSGFINRAYAGDLGGRVFGMKYDVADDKWEKLVLLDLPATVDYLDETSATVTDSLGQKFMTKPDATIEYDGECLYMGTGDREHLTNTDNVDAFYTICNKWDKAQDVDGNDIVDAYGDFVYESVAFSDLVDVTDNQVQDGTAAQKVTVNSALNDGSGWFIRMEHDGEKITSSPKVIDGKVFYTTFTPGTGGTVSVDPCNVSFDLGVSRLYAVDYKTGAAVMNLDDSDDVLTKDDRSVIIGTSVAPEPVLTTIGDVTTLVAGSGGKLLMLDVDNNAIIKRYYWRQIK